ncbi:hypothetical protein GDO81_022092 [Engystomops pustulosus]|uniref:Secreted protein n=1 Tax=Engystomops pustulosus TaxID=76066 RepID=A0AAV6Z8J2_ENGPU|nr:hypothetical protein GDO81_022092 [Engystomops pustulosus]
MSVVFINALTTRNFFAFPFFTPHLQKSFRFSHVGSRVRTWFLCNNLHFRVTVFNILRRVLGSRRKKIVNLRHFLVAWFLLPK